MAARKAKDNTTLESLGRITADMGNIRINDDNGSRVNSFTPQKQSTMPEPMMIHSTPPVITISDTHHDARPIDVGLPVPMPEMLSGIRDNVEKTHRPDDWYAMRRAEKERWRKSEQEFADLPPATPDDDEPPHLRQNQQIPEQRRSETPIARPFTPRDSDDAAMARALQERFPELSADELQAILLAGRSQLQREEEQRRESFNRPQKGKKVNRTNWPDSDEEIPPRPGARPFSGRSHPEAKNSGSFYSDSENHLRSDRGSGRSTSSPNNSFQGHPPGLSPPYGSMRFEDIKYSGISLGGGPVDVRNVNTGNTTTITYNDSMNDKSVRNYYH